MEDTLRPDIEFASQVMDLSLNSYNIGDTLNGLALAAAAMLLDVTLDEDRKIDGENLQSNTERFFRNVSASVEFAKAELEKESNMDSV